MDDLVDGYDGYYQARLWESLPVIYQVLDTATFADLDTAVSSGPGPLRELVDRIGTQIAVVRRSIDGLWADQSIETCADWVIPYIGDLVATRLVIGLDARGQRLDVANTIGWRRRKGTVATLDAVARDITGWSVHVLEAFRRLARTRHNLDPRVGGRTPATPGQVAGDSLLTAEGLVEPFARTPPEDSPTCAPHRAPCSQAVRSTRPFTTPTCGVEAARRAGTARRSSSCTAGGCCAWRSPTARPSPCPAATVSTCSIRPGVRPPCSCRLFRTPRRSWAPRAHGRCRVR